MVKLSVNEPYKLDAPSLSFYIRVDGQWIQGPLMNKDKFMNDGWMREVIGVHRPTEQGTFVKPMMFAKIQTTTEKLGNSNIDDHKKKMSSVGQIRITVHRESVVKKSTSSLEEYKANDYASKFHEKALAKESQSHGTILGEDKPTADVSVWTTEYLDGEDYPIGVFIFKYRSLEALKALRIIDRSPTPEAVAAAVASAVASSPSPSPAVNLENLTPAQKSQLEVFLQGLMSGGNGSPVKREDPSAPTIKHELDDEKESGSPRKKPKKMLGKVTIDLTEDEPEAIPLE
ncbi:hypothetical protein LAWI1_G002698 [Lachnellula willkommii]|uniref:DUF7918 domain-containing protein n=1 Tax=Lachnellula willkommii TaxID=215461 RepID=A0A559MHH0_9HELO|nr:hypothetical protein LAWI1_G002698 [Lachnellula willkommii]